MAMSDTGEHKKRRRTVSRSTTRLTAPQAEVEPPANCTDHAKQGGIIRAGAVESHVSSRLNEIEDKAMAVDPTKIVVSIVIIALIFIAVITWFIAVTPTKQ
jgi:hypothetical protein